jgi:mono/diheme cytochrome c family protein
MRSTRLLVTLGAAGLLAFGGCGGDDPAPADRPSEAATGDGKAVFASTCGGCHTLADAGTGGKIGPDLDDLKPDKARVEAAIKSGPGSMPENLVTGDDAVAVADYVASAAGG